MYGRSHKATDILFLTMARNDFTFGNRSGKGDRIGGALTSVRLRLVRVHGAKGGRHLDTILKKTPE